MFELFLIVIILGIVEGVTEFLPVSSTGHLIIVADFLSSWGANVKLPESFEVAIQLGAILAVVVTYPHRFFGVFDLKGVGFKGWRAIGIFALTCAPVLAMGAFLHSFIKAKLFSVSVVAAGLIVGGVLLIWAERFSAAKKNLMEQVTFLDAIKIGVFQCLALWPGMSRAGSTIFAARVVGLDRALAAELSFVVAVPVISAAVIYDLYKDVAVNGFAGIEWSLLGGIVSFFVALISIKFFVGVLQRFSLVPFAIYRILLGSALLLF